MGEKCSLQFSEIHNIALNSLFCLICHYPIDASWPILFTPLQKSGNLTAPGGLLNTTIWKNFIGNHLEMAGMLEKFFADDLVNHLSVTVHCD